MSCITEILRLKGNNDFIECPGGGVGAEGGGSYKGYEYLITLNDQGIRCGYVALPSYHIYTNSSSYNDLDIEVHGSLTFMDSHHPLKDLLSIPCTDIWIGFDCGHGYDIFDGDKVKQYFGEKIHTRNADFFKMMNEISFRKKTLKDFWYAERACHSIIDQLIEVAA